MALIFDPASQGKKLTSHWQELVMARQDAGKLGAQKPFTPLQEKQLQEAAELLYPVHAVGYNWLQSNKVSAQRLAKEIERITAYYRSKGRSCEQVILVTHSMGGLVARACAELPGMAERILGVVHGVMPALGAPATYKRIRAGFEGAGQVVLGRNAAECTAVMANAPGPLELLPTAQYKTWSNRGERHWLRVSYVGMGQRGMAEEMENFLGEGDPYRNIYLNNSADWWKLIREDLIDPAGKEDSEMNEDRKLDKNQRKSCFDNYAKNMQKAHELHNLIDRKYHARTYAYYAAEHQRPSWNEVQWKCPVSLPGDIRTAKAKDDNMNGEIYLSVGKNIARRFVLQGPAGPGDGTVPAESGAAPTAHVRQIFRHEGTLKGHDSYDHQFSYNSKITQAATLYSIVSIACESEWIRSGFKKS